ncbi:hypothetical protein ACU4GD_21625 [Cupriavidus basilensis]
MPGCCSFGLEETIALIGSHFDASVEADASARLHDATEGWPLGLQLALAAITHAPDPVAAIDAFANSTGRHARALRDRAARPALRCGYRIPYAVSRLWSCCMPIFAAAVTGFAGCAGAPAASYA